MDAKKTGLFICLLRKQKGMTQAELAGRIGVTDKAVSRWDTGKGFPDISVLPPLAEALGTPVTELLAGEPMSTEERAERSDSAALEALRYARSMGRNTAAVLLGVAGVFLLLMPLFMAGRTWGLRLAGLGLLALAMAVRRVRLPRLPRPDWGRLLSPAAARIGTAVCLGAALVLELLPYGAVLNFGRIAEDGTIGTFRETYSYFSLMPFGYANFFPLLTGVLTVVLLLLSLLQAVRPRPRRGSRLFVLDILTAVLSVMPWVVFGADYVSGVGVGITAALLLAAVCLALANREKTAKNSEKEVDFPKSS